MGILDFWKKRPKQTQHGEGLVGGNQIFNGYYIDEYNHELRGISALKTYDKMRRTDAQVEALIQAIKLPILGANWYIEEDDDEVREVFEQMLFSHWNWDEFLEDAISFLVFGFKYFEKIYSVEKINGKDRLIVSGVVSCLQMAHEKWLTQDGQKGVTQQVNGDQAQGRTLRSAPLEKLFLFTNKKEGESLEGISILRPAYKHWWYKENLYKIQAISAERFGAGIPHVRYPEGSGDKEKKIAANMGRNIRTNQEAYIATSKEWEVEILTPKNNTQAESITKMIEDHNNMILQCGLAGFLGLGRGRGSGTYAQSVSEKEFFSRSLAYVVKKITSVIDEELKYLTKINFGERDWYPKLKASNFAEKDNKAWSEVLATLVSAGLLTPSEQVEEWARGYFELPEMTEEEKEENKKAKATPKPSEEEKPEEEPEPEEEEKKNEKIKVGEAVVSDLFSDISKTEKSFNKNIDAVEIGLRSQYKEVEGWVSEQENEIKAKLLEFYDSAQTELRDGARVLVYDEKLQNKILRFLEKKKTAMSDYVQGEPMKAAFDFVEKSAEKTLADIFGLIERKKKSPAIKSFMLGYVSNITAWINNEMRRIMEKTVENFGTQVLIAEAKKQVEAIKMNRNILSLSFITHPRGAFKSQIYDETSANGFTQFKMTVPPKMINNVLDGSPSGTTSKNLFYILPAAMWAKKMSDDNANPVSNLGIHHGSYEYYFPVLNSRLDEEEATAKKQRDFWLLLVAAALAANAMKDEEEN